jgi:hypothetical protein
MAFKIKSQKQQNYIFILLVLLISCKDNVNKEYYKTGELKKETVQIDKNSQLINDYFINGQLAASGKVINGYKNDFWKEWYVDGTLKWSGFYEKNERNYTSQNIDRGNCRLFIKDNPEKLETKKSYQLRIIVPNIHPEDLVVASNNGIIKLNANRDDFDFTIYPKNKGALNLFIYTEIKNKLVLLTKMQLEIVN